MNVIKIERGGHMNELFTSPEITADLNAMASICILIHLEKLKRLLAKDIGPVKRFKNRFKVFVPKINIRPSMACYLMIALLTFDEVRISTGKEFNSHSKLLNNQFVDSELNGLENCNSKVELGSSILSFENSKMKYSKDLIRIQEPVKEKYSRVKYEFKTSSLNRKLKSRKRAKLVRLSDLTPIANSDTYSSQNYQTEKNSNQNYFKNYHRIQIQK